MDKTKFACGTAALGCVGQLAQPNTAEGGCATHQSMTDGVLGLLGENRPVKKGRNEDIRIP
jgi:hypothetical protein